MAERVVEDDEPVKKQPPAPTVLTSKYLERLDAILGLHPLTPDRLKPKARARYEELILKADRLSSEHSDTYNGLMIKLVRKPDSYSVRDHNYYAAIYQIGLYREDLASILEARRTEVGPISTPEPHPLPREGWVYFIEAGGNIKIGFTANVPSRMAQIETSTPFEVTVLRQERGSTDTEASYHKRFAAQRIRREWFRFEGELKEFLEGGGS